MPACVAKIVSNVRRLIRRSGTALLAALLLCAGAFWHEPASAAQALISHRGLYAMNLTDAAPASGVVDAKGEMFFEWSEQCDGWIVNQHVALRLSMNEDESMAIDLLFSAWESRDGKSLRFAMKHSSDGAIVEVLEGTAELGDDGGKAIFTKPPGLELSLPPRTMFPTGYWLKLLKRLDSGKGGLDAPVFDGSTSDGAYQVTTFLGRAESRVRPGGDADNPITETVWPVHMAYFSLEPGDGEPLFEIGEAINAGGVAHVFDLDYGWFSVRADLQRLEILPAPTSC